MRPVTIHILLLLLLTLSLLSCDRTPGGVLSVNSMADLIVDLQLADAYMDNHSEDYPTDSSKLVLKQSIFKKHGITSQDYDSSMVWYAHNMEDYIKAHDKAIGILKNRYDKLAKNDVPERLDREDVGIPTRDVVPGSGIKPRRPFKHGIHGDTADLWQGERRFILTQGSRQGFITFDVVPDAEKRPGDRYQLACKLTRGGNRFKVSLNVDYSDGATAQMVRNTDHEGWVMIDLQSDTARQVRRVYGYVGYDIQRGSMSIVDSLMILRSHFNQNNYSFIHSQRLLQRNP